MSPNSLSRHLNTFYTKLVGFFVVKQMQLRILKRLILSQPGIGVYINISYGSQTMKATHVLSMSNQIFSSFESEHWSISWTITIVFHSFEHFSVTVWFLMSEVPLLFLSTFSSKRMKEWTIRRLRKKRVVEWSRRRSIETYARFISFLSWRRRRRQSPYFAFRGGTSLLFIQALRNNSVNILCFVESFYIL